MGTPSETVEVVKEILADSHIEIGSLNFLVRATNPDVIDYLLSNVPLRSLEKRRSAIMRVIYSQWSKNSFKPGTAGQKILLVCLKHVKSLKDGSYTANQFLRLLYNSVREGDIELVKAFLDAGTGIRFIDYFSIPYLRFNQVEMVKFLVQQGLPEGSSGLFTRSLFALPDFTRADFETLIKLGLPLNLKFSEYNYMALKLEDFLTEGLPLKSGFSCFDQNWLEIAMIAGRLDLAKAAYKHGLRISTRRLGDTDICAFFTKQPMDLARIIAISQYYVKLLEFAVGIRDDNSGLFLLPKEIFLGVVGVFLYELEVDEIMSDLFEPEITTGFQKFAQNNLRIIPNQSHETAYSR